MKRLILWTIVMLAASSCGTPTVESPPATDIVADVGSDGAIQGDECITDFDCKDAKGKTPCGLPLCTNGTCGWSYKTEGTPCSDPQLETTACEVAQCTAEGQCNLKILEVGEPCDTSRSFDECEEATCDKDKKCKVGPRKDEAPCGLGVCGNYCIAGKCEIAPDEAYDDDNPCTIDFCDQNTAIVHEPVPGLVACDDGNPCTGEGTCKQGKCATSESGDCNDGLPCTKDTCGSEGCEHVADDAPCADDDSCFERKCNTDQGCVNGAVKKGADCDDGDECTTGDKCNNKGVCLGPENTCKCKSDAECDKGDKCLPRTCNLADGFCEVNQKLKVVCDDSKDGICGENLCDPKTGECAVVALNVGKTCDDNDVCTSTSACKEGACTGDVDTKCDDGNPCTADSCNPVKGCTATPIDAPCDDGSACTANDSCSNGGCVGTAKSCSDNVPCTFDTCDDKNGDCTNTPKTDTCDDGNPCTKETCDPKTGCSVAPDDAATCDDKDKCTQTACQAGQCVTTQINKNIPGCGCAQNGDCNDNNDCTSDTCVEGDCKFDPGPMATKACESANLCQTGTKCDKGACTGGSPKKCDDGNPCTIDSCNTATGKCSAAAVKDGTACDDGQLCTLNDVCSAGKCLAGQPKECGSGGKACVEGFCEASSGKCKTKPSAKGTLCDDGMFCTQNDACDANGNCEGGEKKDCSSLSETCVSGTCDEGKKACVAVNDPKNTECNDGQYCTIKDACDGNGGCTINKLRSCATSTTACQVNQCDEAKNTCALVAAKDGTECSDGDKCTSGDTCKSGKCLSGVETCKNCKLASDCNDNNVCTNDSCTLGACVNKATSGVCNDGDNCTISDSCKNGKCSSGALKNCNDGTKCSSDSCDKVTGKCKYTAANAGKTCELGNYSLCSGTKCFCKLFDKTYVASATQPDAYRSLKQNSAGKIGVLGTVYSKTTGYDSSYSIYSATGSLQTYVKLSKGNGNDYLNGLTEITTSKAGTSTFYAVGYTPGSGSVNKGWLVAFTDMGKKLVDKTLTGPSSSKADYLYDIETDGSSLYAVGKTFGKSSKYSSAWVTKLSTTGSTLWNKYLVTSYSSNYADLDYYGGYIYTYYRNGSDTYLQRLKTSTGSVYATRKITGATPTDVVVSFPYVWVLGHSSNKAAAYRVGSTVFGSTTTYLTKLYTSAGSFISAGTPTSGGGLQTVSYSIGTAKTMSISSAGKQGSVYNLPFKKYAFPAAIIQTNPSPATYAIISSDGTGNSRIVNVSSTASTSCKIVFEGIDKN